MSELPRGWAPATLGEIADTKLGKMLSAKARNTDGRPYLRNKNVQWGRIDVDDLLRMDFSDEEFERFRLREGDLLVCEGGEVGRAAIWRAPLADCAYQKALHRVRPLGGVMPEYVLYLLMHYSGSHQFDRFVAGSTIAHLPQEDLRRLPIPLPPLGEQRRIVAAIEEQLSRLDAAAQNLRAASARLTQLKEAIFMAIDRPEWPRQALDDLLRQPLRNGVSAKASPSGTVRIVTLTAVTQNSFIDANTKLAEVDGERAAGLWLEPGDVLVERSNTPELVGTAALYAGQPSWAIFPDLVIRVRPTNELLPEFLALFLQTRAARDYFRKAAQGISGSMPKIGQGDIRRLQVPVPSVAEQGVAVADTESRLALLAALQRQLRTTGQHSASLRRSILASAFRGELVPQDPNEQPASVLLERIAAERAAAPAKPRRRRVSAGH